jgi:hypothetical protein
MHKMSVLDSPNGTNSPMLTESNLRCVTSKSPEKLISPRGLTRLSIASGRTIDSGRSASFASNSFDNDTPSRRASRLTDVSDPSESGAYSDDGLLSHNDLTSAAISQLNEFEGEGPDNRTTSVSKLFSSVSYVSNDDDGVGLDSDTSAMAAALGVPPASMLSSVGSVANYNRNSDYSIFPEDSNVGLGQLQLISLFRDSAGSVNGPSLLETLASTTNTSGSSSVVAQTHLSGVLSQATNVAICNIFSTMREHVVAVNAFISMVSPHDEQRSHRNSIRAVLARQVRRVVNAKVIELGLHALDCFLPDDVLRLSPVLWRSSTISWQTGLLERLNRLAENPGEVNDSALDDEECRSVADISESPPYRVTADHIVSGAILTTVGGESHVQVGVDTIHVEIVPFQRIDQLLLALIEDVALLVGQQNLFKRSLTIIRAWWVYETTSYIGCAMKHYLSDLTIAIMSCAIFNQFHAVITEPFHALYLFLVTFAEIDWRNSAVSIAGDAVFQSDLELTPTVSHPTNYVPLISASLISKYSTALASPPSSQRNSGAHNTSGEASTPSSVGTIGEGVVTGVTSSPVPGSYGRVDSPAKVVVTGSLDTSAVSMCSADWSSFELFERREINIINPINNSNLVTDKLNTRRAKRIIKVFQMGSRNLQVAIRTAQIRENNSAPLPAMNTFFKGICNRFETGWRPDVPNNLLENRLEDPRSKRLGLKRSSTVIYQLK